MEKNNGVTASVLDVGLPLTFGAKRFDYQRPEDVAKIVEWAEKVKKAGEGK